MKRLLYGLSACAVGLILAAPLGALGYSHDEGGFRWCYDVYEEDGGWTASIYQVYQLDENGKVKGEWWDPVFDATTMVVPATLPAVGTNEYAVAEAVYDEDGAFLSNKYTTVYGPEVKSISAVVTYVDACNEGNDKLTSVTIPETVEKVEGFGTRRKSSFQTASRESATMRLTPTATQKWPSWRGWSSPSGWRKSASVPLKAVRR